MRNLQNAIDEIMPLIYSTEIRDAYTQGHSENVAFYAKELAALLGLSKNECNDIFLAGLLHDIGKIGIPDSILLKPSKLEKEEYSLVQLHSHISGEIIDKLQNFSYLKEAVRHHHENYDGSGYPDKLKGKEIPLSARILSIVDVFDALTTGRVYRASIPLNEALEIMHTMQKNLKFDPEIYKVFIPFIKKLGVYKNRESKKIEYIELEKQRNNFFFTDHLTKLLNQEALLAYLRKSYDYGYKISLIVLKIEDFKLYNKEFGLKKADLLLKNIASNLLSNLSAHITMKEPQNKDLFLFRIHSDKFVVLYIGQRSEFLAYKMDKINQQIQQEQHIKINYKFILKNSNAIKNTNNLIGYLL